MRNLLCYALPILLITIIMTSCAPIKTLDVWQDPAHDQPLQKVLLIAVAQNDIIRRQFENVLALQLAKKGVEGIASHKVLPQAVADLDRETVIAKVEELGVQHVLVARSIKKTEITNHQMGGPFFAPTALYNDGWYTYYAGSVIYPEREYDTDYFTLATNLFVLGKNKPVWSYLSQVKVEGSRQGAVTEFIPVLVEQLQRSHLLR